MKAAASKPAPRVLILNDAQEADGEMLKTIGSLLSPGSQVVTVGEDSPGTTSWRVRYKHVYGSSLSLNTVKKTRVDLTDTVLVRPNEDVSYQERDGRILAKTRLVLLARQEAKTVKPLRIVAQVQESETAEKLQHLIDTLCKDKSVTLETIDAAKLSAGAIVQVLWSPELKSVYMDLMDSDGSEISLLKASFFGPPGEKRSFADITELGLKNNAVPLGILRANGELVLRSARACNLA